MIPARITPARSSRVVTARLVSRRNEAKNRPKFNSSANTIPTTLTTGPWPRPPVTRPEASVATMNSVPSETSSSRPRSFDCQKLGRSLNGTAQTRSNALRAAAVTPSPAHRDVARPITSAIALPCRAWTSSFSPTIGN